MRYFHSISHGKESFFRKTFVFFSPKNWWHYSEPGPLALVSPRDMRRRGLHRTWLSWAPSCPEHQELLLLAPYSQQTQQSRLLRPAESVFSIVTSLPACPWINRSQARLKVKQWEWLPLTPRSGCTSHKAHVQSPFTWGLRFHSVVQNQNSNQKRYNVPVFQINKC